MKTWLGAVLAIAFVAPAWADLADLIQRYDATNWQQSDEKAKLSELEGQLAELEAMTETSEVLMWQGAIGASIAREKGGAGALGLIKRAKKDLDAALEAEASNHMARAIRGNIFAKAPGWPLSVGSSKKARADFEAALAAQPDNILALQGYGEFLAEEGETDKARAQFEKALTLAPRAGREMADKARQDQIRGLLDAL